VAERWRPVPAFQGLYQVSDHRQIRIGTRKVNGVLVPEHVLSADEIATARLDVEDLARKVWGAEIVDVAPSLADPPVSVPPIVEPVVGQHDPGEMDEIPSPFEPRVIDGILVDEPNPDGGSAPVEWQRRVGDVLVGDPLPTVHITSRVHPDDLRGSVGSVGPLEPRDPSTLVQIVEGGGADGKSRVVYDRNAAPADDRAVTTTLVPVASSAEPESEESDASSSDVGAVAVELDGVSGARTESEPSTSDAAPETPPDAAPVAPTSKRSRKKVKS
jgi:hypothetical protein